MQEEILWILLKWNLKQNQLGMGHGNNYYIALHLCCFIYMYYSGSILAINWFDHITPMSFLANQAAGKKWLHNIP